MSCERHAALRARARALRLEGWARPDTCRELGIKNNGTFQSWINDLPAVPGDRTRRTDPGLKEKAIALRKEGRSYREIEEVLTTPKSTLSGWLKDIPLTEEHRHALAQRDRGAVQRRADSRSARRHAERERMISDIIDSFGAPSERDLIVAGTVAYWAEGAKMKPWNRSEIVRFINSDATMITLFLDWLDLLGVTRDRLVLRVSIHESADVAKAEGSWSNVTGVP